jgi:hypothetical protein
MPLRANLKLQLQRQQIEEEKKRNQQVVSQSYKPPPSQPQIIQMPVSSSVTNVEIAPQVLKVSSNKTLKTTAGMLLSLTHISWFLWLQYKFGLWCLVSLSTVFQL